MSLSEYPKVTVVIASRDGGHLLIEGLESIFALEYPQTKLEVVVVDDGSVDGSAAVAENRFADRIRSSQFRIIRNQHPTGVPRAYNLGFRHASRTSRYLLKLDNDVVVHPRSLGALAECAEENPTAGILGGTVYFRSDPSRVQFLGGYLSSPWKGPASIAPPEIAAAPGGSTEPVEVDVVNSCMALIRREVFEVSGLLPEEYGLYEYEDYDFAFRIKSDGYSSLYCPEAIAHHEVSATSKDNALSKVRAHLRIRNGLLFMWRHAPRSWFVPYVAYNLAKLPVDVVRGRIPLKAVGGWLDGFLSIRGDGQDREVLPPSA